MMKWTKLFCGTFLAMAMFVSGNVASKAEAAALDPSVQLPIQVGLVGATATAAAHVQAATVTDDSELADTKTAESAAPKAAPAPAKPDAQTVAGMPFKNTLNIVATAYGPDDSTGPYAGLTFTGTHVRQGVIAVDPNVIPLGSKVYITGYKNPLLPAGGFVATAEDTGGAIKGNRIDIYMNAPTPQVLDFGRQDVKVYVLK